MPKKRGRGPVWLASGELKRRGGEQRDRRVEREPENSDNCCNLILLYIFYIIT
jgi:hypothetical protein